VNGVSCPIVKIFNGGVDCTLPRGAGSNQPVVAVADTLFGQPAQLISYAAPNITQLIGCDTPSSTGINTLSIANCPRGGGSNITVVGTNFGGSGATVLIGTSQCTNVIHDSFTPDNLLTCLLPTGNVT
jgi:hypothetical protein